VAKDRVSRLRALGGELSLAFLRENEGTRREIIVETRSRGRFRGLCDNGLRVVFDAGSPVHTGDLVYAVLEAGGEPNGRELNARVEE
jgi:tRNA A37 methylthiotransferase MiaB